MIGLTLLQAAAQTTAQTIAQATTSATDNPTATLGLAIAVPFILQTLKNSSWFPFLTRETNRINFLVGAICALASVVGIHASYDVATGGTITLPPLHTLWQAFIQWAGQQMTYKGFVVPAETLGDIRELLHRMEIGQIVEQQRASLPPALPPPERRP